MRERSEKLLRIVCVVLGVLLVLQVARIVIRGNPLAHAKFPALPSLPVSAEGQPAGTNAPTARVGRGTNALAHSASGTNAPAADAAAGRNDTNMTVQGAPTTNNTVSISSVVVGGKTNNPATQPPTGSTTNQILEVTSAAGSNGAAGAAANLVTNALAQSPPGLANPGPPNRPGIAAGPMNLPGGPGMMKKPPEPPPEILARVDRVVDSEIFGQVMRPLPMALLGIAGNMAFLRAPSGQMGAVKEGDELGGVKLLRIGINRVLVQEKGEKKELTIFSGLGSESLLAK